MTYIQEKIIHSAFYCKSSICSQAENATKTCINVTSLYIALNYSLNSLNNIESTIFWGVRRYMNESTIEVHRAELIKQHLGAFSSPSKNTFENSESAFEHCLIEQVHRYIKDKYLCISSSDKAYGIDNTNEEIAYARTQKYPIEYIAARLYATRIGEIEYGYGFRTPHFDYLQRSDYPLFLLTSILYLYLHGLIKDDQSDVRTKKLLDTLCQSNENALLTARSIVSKAGKIGRMGRTPQTCGDKLPVILNNMIVFLRDKKNIRLDNANYTELLNNHLRVPLLLTCFTSLYDSTESPISGSKGGLFSFLNDLYMCTRKQQLVLFSMILKAGCWANFQYMLCLNNDFSHAERCELVNENNELFNQLERLNVDFGSIRKSVDYVFRNKNIKDKLFTVSKKKLTLLIDVIATLDEVNIQDKSDKQVKAEIKYLEGYITYNLISIYKITSGMEKQLNDFEPCDFVKFKNVIKATQYLIDKNIIHQNEEYCLIGLFIKYGIEAEVIVKDSFKFFDNKWKGEPYSPYLSLIKLLSNYDFMNADRLSLFPQYLIGIKIQSNLNNLALCLRIINDIDDKYDKSAVLDYFTKRLLRLDRFVDDEVINQQFLDIGKALLIKFTSSKVKTTKVDTAPNPNRFWRSESSPQADSSNDDRLIPSNRSMSH